MVRPPRNNDDITYSIIHQREVRKILTVKQETFVQELVKGKSQREAYKAAYNASNMKDSTIDEHACRIFKKDKVHARYIELMSKAASKAVATREEILLELTSIAMPPLTQKGERAEESAQEKNTRLKALELLGKYHALFTERVNVEQEKPFEINVSVKKE